MDEAWRATSQPGAAHLRTQVVRVGLLASTLASAASGTYLLATHEEPGRPALWGLLATSAVVTAVMTAVRRRRLVRRRYAMRVLHAWAGSQTALIAACAALDGGPRSPFVGLLFLPMVAGAVGFPPRAVIKHGVWITLCLLAGAAATSTLTLPMAVMWTSAIALTSSVASSTSRSLLSLSEDLDRANQRLEHLARVDALTGCLNHRAFHEQLQLDLTRRSRGGDPISLLVLDVDHFKRVNDDHGHPVGDEVLRVLGRVLRGTVRPGDVVGRTGGEEFAVLLPATTLEEAQGIGERLRAAVAAEPMPVAITVSIGLAAGPPVGGSATDLMRTADAALYRAKRGGRDRVVSAPTHEAALPAGPADPDPGPVAGGTSVPAPR